MSGPMAARAAFTRSTDFATVPSMMPTRIFTALTLPFFT